MQEKFVDIIADERGQVTVFLTLIFMILMGALFCVLEGMNIYMETSLSEETFIDAGNDVLSNYSRDLFERYHIFFLDPREKKQIVSDGINYMEHYLDKSSYFAFHCDNLVLSEEKTAVDEDGLYLKHQIREWMKYRQMGKAGKAIEELFDSASTVEKELGAVKDEMNSVDEGKTDTAASESDSDTGQQGKENSKEGIEWKSLKETLGQISHSGILGYAVDDLSKLSDLTVSADDFPSRKKGVSKGRNSDFTLSFSALSEWKNLLGNLDIDIPDSHFLSDEYFLFGYILEHFNCYGSENSNLPSALKYEIEYLIGGENSDQENLKKVANRILILRFLMNYSYACRDKEINAVAGAMADTLCGVLGLPAAGGAVRILLIAAISYGESLLELHTLFSGGEIAAVKDASTWNLYFHNATELLTTKAKVKSGVNNVGYEDYIKLLLAMNKHPKVIYFRMMDLMQANIALKQPGFLMEQCIFRFRWQGNMVCSMGISVPLDRVCSY